MISGLPPIGKDLSPVTREDDSFTSKIAIKCWHVLSTASFTFLLAIVTSSIFKIQLYAFNESESIGISSGIELFGVHLKQVGVAMFVSSENNSQQWGQNNK